jgi:hypothetical protein
LASIEKITLTAEVEKVLLPAFLADADFIKNEISSGAAELFRVNSAFFVTRLESAELVIIAVAGKDLPAAAKIMFNAAKTIGCQSIRFHTKRKALARMLKEFKPEYVETVYRGKL